jgi:hypothetical protein
MSHHNDGIGGNAAAVFIIFLLLNIASAGGHLDWRDGVETYVVTESMVLKNSAKFHSDVPGVRQLYPETWLDRFELFSQPSFVPRSLILSAIAIPIYAASSFLSISPILSVGIFVNSIIIAMISLVIFLFSMELYGSKRLSFVLSLVFSVCSFVWPYNTSLYPQPLQSLLLFTSTYFIFRSAHANPTFICNYLQKSYGNNIRRSPEKKALLYSTAAGILLGLSVFAHPSSLITIPGFLTYAAISAGLHRNRRLALFLAPLVLLLVLMAFINYVRFGAITEFGYYSFGSINALGGWTGLLGLWISPGFGIIFYFPLAVLLPFALKKFTRRNDLRGLLLLIVYVIVVFWLFVGTLSYDEPVSWSGAIAWGPRYMIAILPFIVLSLGIILHHLNMRNLYYLKILVVVALFTAGFAVNLIGKLTWVSYVALYMWQELQLPALGASYLNTVAWNPTYSLIALHFKVLTDNNFLSQIEPRDYRGTEHHFVTYGLAPCQFDIYLYCEFGILPIVILTGTAALLAAFVLEIHLPVSSKILRMITKILRQSRYHEGTSKSWT